MKSSSKGVFCLEGDWWNDLKNPSCAEPILKILDQQYTKKTPNVHKSVHTVSELRELLTIWTQKKYASHPILLLAFHCDPNNLGSLQIGNGKNKRSVSLDDLGNWLEGKCHKRHIHFSSCETMGVHGAAWNRFLKQTGALSVSGYTKVVGWVESVAFELLLLEAMQSCAPMIQGAKKWQNQIRLDYGPLQRRLGFKSRIRKSSWK